jgi:hypothetical protein
VLGPVFKLCAPRLIFGGTGGIRFCFHVFALTGLFFTVPRASFPVFKFCAPGLIFGGTKGVGFRFHVLCFETHFRRYRGRPVPFACFARPDSFLAVPRASGPVFIFYGPRIVLGDTEGVASHFHVFLARTRFRRYRGRWVPLSCFALLDSFSTVPRASSTVFIFCALGLIFGGTKSVRSCFHDLCSLTCFRRCRIRRASFSCFVRPDSIKAVPRASGPVFMLSAPRLVFGGIEGVVSHFHVMRSLTRFRQSRGRRVLFSCFALPDSFSAIPRALRPVVMVCTPGLVFDGTEGVESRFHILCTLTRFRHPCGRRVPFSCFVRHD